MQHYAAFHLGLHCLQKYLFRGFPEYNGLSWSFSVIVEILTIKTCILLNSATSHPTVDHRGALGTR